VKSPSLKKILEILANLALNPSSDEEDYPIIKKPHLKPQEFEKYSPASLIYTPYYSPKNPFD
jgi:hypothetical protein